MRARCPGQELLAAWVDGEVDADVATHLDRCERCARQVRAHRQVKRRTAGLTAQPSPAPGSDLLASLLTVPVAEHTRQRQARCAPGTARWSRPTVVAVGAVAAAGLATVAWMAPTGSDPAGGAGPAAPTVAPVTAPVTAPVIAPVTSSVTSSPAPVSVVGWMRPATR